MNDKNINYKSQKFKSVWSLTLPPGFLLCLIYHLSLLILCIKSIILLHKGQNLLLPFFTFLLHYRNSNGRQSHLPDKHVPTGFLNSRIPILSTFSMHVNHNGLLQMYITCCLLQIKICQWQTIALMLTIWPLSSYWIWILLFSGPKYKTNQCTARQKKSLQYTV